jgi:uncharacterized membrane protein (UPF0127 family)
MRRMLWGILAGLLGLVLVAVLALAGIHAYLRAHPQDLSRLSTITTTQAGEPLTLLVPETDDEKGHGLSGIDSLPADTALLLRSDDGDTRIMMLGMRFALDLVWLDAHCEVVRVVTGANPGLWPLFYAGPGEATAVVEFSVGDAARYGAGEVGATLRGACG